ncbi:MAG: hypothetical protein ACXVBE_04695 [Bdellovibrionota bacterium]
MSPRNRHKIPSPELNFWRQEGAFWIAEREGMEAFIVASGYSEEELKRRLGASYSELFEALNGKPLSAWTAVFIERGISRQKEIEQSAWTPK